MNKNSKNSPFSPEQKAMIWAGLALMAIVVFVATVKASPREGEGSTILSRSQATSTRPNIIIIRTDDQSATDWFEVRPDNGRLVGQNVQDLIAAKGVTFKNSFVSYSLCCPSRAVLLSGQYNHNNNVFGNQPPYDGSAFDHANSLPVWLQNAGYYTVQIGKYMNGGGYDSVGWNEMYRSTNANYYGPGLNENGTVINYSTTTYNSDLFTRKAVNFIKNHSYGRRPFYLMVDYVAPHQTLSGNEAIPASRHAHVFDTSSGYVMPQSPNFNEADMSDKPAGIGMQELPLMSTSTIESTLREHRSRLASLLAVDEGVASIVAELTRSGLLENTIIMVTSDNGYEQGEHRLPSGKQMIYEESVKVPLMIRGPGFQEGTVVNEVVGNTDIAPTFVEVAQATAGKIMDGVSLVPLLRGTGTIARKNFLLDHYYYTVVQHNLRRDITGIRNSNYKYMEYLDTAGQVIVRELYNFIPDQCRASADPYELENQAENPCYASLIGRLHSELQQLRTCSGSGNATSTSCQL